MKSMSDRFFLDSNIILYAFLKGDKKNSVARNIISKEICFLSNQVIAEVSFNLLKKGGYSNQQITALTRELYLDFEVRAIDEAVFLKAASLREQFSISFWDSLIVGSALLSECDFLYSEDMQNGLKIDFLTIVNPFNSEQKV